MFNRCNINTICFIGLILVIFETSAQTTECFEVQKDRRVECAEPSATVSGISRAACQRACQKANSCVMFDYNVDSHDCLVFNQRLVHLPTKFAVRRGQDSSEISNCFDNGPHLVADPGFEHHRLKRRCLNDAARRPDSEASVPDPTVKQTRRTTTTKIRRPISLTTTARRTRRTTTTTTTTTTTPTTTTTTTTTTPTTTTVNVIRPNHIFINNAASRDCSTQARSIGNRRDALPPRPILLWYQSSKFVLKERRNGRRRSMLKGSNVTKTTSEQCKAQCLENRWNICASAEYNLTSWECHLSAHAKPNSRTWDWVPAEQFDHYEKRCVSSQAAAVCPGPHRIELQWTYSDFSHARHRMHVNEVNFCIELCAELKARGELDCKSGVFLDNVEGDEDNCFLSYRTLNNDSGHLVFEGRPTGFAMKCN